MLRFLKWLLAMMLLLIIGIGIYLVFFINLNDFKAPIESKVKQITGRELKINGDIGWSLYPDIGLSLRDVTFSNPDNLSSRDFINIQTMSLQMALLPLLSQQLQIQGIDVNHVVINWIAGKNGENSLSGMVKNAQVVNPITNPTAIDNQEKKQVNDEKLSPLVLLKQLSVDHINISNISVKSYVSDKLVATLTLNYFNLKNLQLDEKTAFDFQVHSSSDGKELLLKGNGDLLIDSEVSTINLLPTNVLISIDGVDVPNKKISINLLLSAIAEIKKKDVAINIDQLHINNIKGKGDINVNYASIIPKIRANLAFGNVDLTPFVKTKEAITEKNENKLVNGHVSQSKKAVKSNQNNKAPDLGFLDEMNAVLKISIDSIKYKKINTQDWSLNAEINKGELIIHQLMGQLYDGTMNFSGTLSNESHEPNYRFKQDIRHVQILPLLSDSADMKLLSGQASLSFIGSGTTLVPNDILMNIKGEGDFTISQGELYGINVAQKIRDIKAQFKDQHSDVSVAKKTDFTELNGTIKLAQGKIINPMLSIHSTLFVFNGQGNADLISQLIDYHFNIKGVARNNYQDPLKGLAIPFIINGTFAEPKFALDTDALLKAKAKQEFKRVEKKLEQKLKEKLFEHFGLF